MPFPFTNDLNVDSVAVPATKLWEKLVGLDDSKDVKVTHIALGFGGVQAGETGQQNISGFLQSTQYRVYLLTMDLDSQVLHRQHQFQPHQQLEPGLHIQMLWG